jgi:protein-serine/threonine kinase
MIMNYAQGGELFDHILTRRYLRDSEASRLFSQLILGVTYLHAYGIVHRDLKLENLLLDGDRNLIITDFGFANWFRQSVGGIGVAADSEMLSTSCGSACYAAPELVINDVGSQSLTKES